MVARTLPPRDEASRRLPKSARLLTSRDFKFFPFRRVQTDLFTFVFTTSGSGRIGISISKKVLRRAVARNRVRRLIREAYRHQQPTFRTADLHVIGAPRLTGVWDQLKRSDVEARLVDLAARLK